MARKRRREAEPRAAEALLDGLFRRVGLLDEARAWRALAAFARAAGRDLGRRARAERLRDGTLMVRVASSAWANELGFLKASLLDKVRREPGGEGVRDLRFTVGPLGDAPEFPQPGPPTPTALPSIAPPRPPTPQELADEHALARTLSAVEDPALRRALGGLIAKARRRG